MPVGHLLTEVDSVALADAAGEAWIVKPYNNDSYPLLVAACATAGFTPRISHHVKE